MQVCSNATPGIQSASELTISKPYVKHMDVFVRTGVWFVGLGSEAGGNTPCKSGLISPQLDFKAEAKQILVMTRKYFEKQVNL
jgi:hypothetical protein